MDRSRKCLIDSKENIRCNPRRKFFNGNLNAIRIQNMFYFVHFIYYSECIVKRNFWAGLSLWNVAISPYLRCKRSGMGWLHRKARSIAAVKRTGTRSRDTCWKSKVRRANYRPEFPSTRQKAAERFPSSARRGRISQRNLRVAREHGNDRWKLFNSKVHVEMAISMVTIENCREIMAGLCAAAPRPLTSN